MNVKHWVRRNVLDRPLSRWLAKYFAQQLKLGITMDTYCEAYITRKDGKVEWLTPKKGVHNTVHTDGIDQVIAQISGTPGAAFTYIALTNNGDAPAAGDTALTGEINNDNGGGRAAGSYSHTNDTATWAVSKTFTATNSGFTVQKSGLFNAASGPVMLCSATFTSAVLSSGDTLTVNWNGTIS